jgi:hypothetical protein
MLRSEYFIVYELLLDKSPGKGLWAILLIYRRYVGAERNLTVGVLYVLIAWLCYVWWQNLPVLGLLLQYL